jgi:hypothetical protein
MHSVLFEESILMEISETKEYHLLKKLKLLVANR